MSCAAQPSYKCCAVFSAESDECCPKICRIIYIFGGWGTVEVLYHIHGNCCFVGFEVGVVCTCVCLCVHMHLCVCAHVQPKAFNLEIVVSQTRFLPQSCSRSVW